MLSLYLQAMVSLESLWVFHVLQSGVHLQAQKWVSEEQGNRRTGKGYEHDDANDKIYRDKHEIADQVAHMMMISDSHRPKF